MPTTDERTSPEDDPTYGRGFGQLRGPLHWPSLTARETENALPVLRGWVERLADRFALDVRVVPPCWERHPAMVEILSALRDHERGCYADTAAPTAGFEFIRALYDTRRILTDIASRTGCSAAEHRDDRTRTQFRPASPDQTGPQGILTPAPGRADGGTRGPFA